MMKRIAAGLLFGALALSPGLALAEGDAHSVEQLAVEIAHTAGQHAVLAHHYRIKAADARAEAMRHESMGAAYAGGKLTQRDRMKRHCKGISDNYSGMAADFDALAKLHEEEAGKAE